MRLVPNRWMTNGDADMLVTLVTAGLCGLLYFGLSWRVVQVRQSAKVSLGDGGDEQLLQRIRAHANFAEYVPICLILLALVEDSYEVAPVGLWVAGFLLVGVRVFHAVGMSRNSANPFRLVGALGTWIVMVALSLWALETAVVLYG